MANNNEEFKDEEPMKIGTGFLVRVLLIVFGLISVIIGVPYLLMHH